MGSEAISISPVEYGHGSTIMEGLLVRDGETAGPAPIVMLCHGAEGRSDALVEFGRRIVPWGYQAFVMDLYGQDVRPTPDKFLELMQPFMEDRAMLADRLSAVASAVADLPQVDPARIAAVGFCFGGLCVLDMARIGLPVTGVASFHGVLTAPPGWSPQPIGSKVAVYHGWDDPFAPPKDVVALAAELTEAGADWQIQAFGHTLHAFMAEGADNPELGIRYNPRSARRAWSGLELFLAECLDPGNVP